MQSFTKCKNNIHVHLQLDNTTAVAYLNKMGGTRSKQLVHVTQDIFQYALSRQITITAEHLPGVQDWSNWQLQPKMFPVLNSKWGTFVVDLFADRLNAQIPIFYSWKPDPTAAAIDCVSTAMDRGTGVRVSSICIDRAMSGKGHEGSSSVSVSDTDMAYPSMVSKTAGYDCGLSGVVTTTKRSIVVTKTRMSPIGSGRKPAASVLESVRHRAAAEGCGKYN